MPWMGLEPTTFTLRDRCPDLRGYSILWMGLEPRTFTLRDRRPHLRVLLL